MTRRRHRVALSVAMLLVGTVAFAALWARSYQRQEALNRQLIAALVKQDVVRALALVNAGADPNTPFEPLSPPSLTQIWNRMFHRMALPINGTPSAFAMACGAFWIDGNPTRSTFLQDFDLDAPQLVLAMLQHGAKVNAKDSEQRTPLMWSIWIYHPKTVGVLLRYGADMNAQDSEGKSALRYVLECHSEEGADTNILRQLLAHGANPRLADRTGVTEIQFAQQYSNLDVQRLIWRAGAKK